MIELIAHEHHMDFVEALTEMHRLRYRVFRERLKWKVRVRDGMEFDEFDELRPVYLLSRLDESVQGCVRLLPTAGPTMLGKVFPQLLDGKPVPKSAAIWESSRFALDLSPAAMRAESGLAAATFELFAGMIEFGLSRQLTEIVTVTDIRIERILKRAQWPLQRLGSVQEIGTTQAVAGALDVSFAALDRVRDACHIRGRVLWAPVDLPPRPEMHIGPRL